jgi:tetratricopeptide (TPR) repeat protein
LPYCNRGKIWENRNQSEAAIEDYTSAIALQPDEAALWRIRAFLFRKIGNYAAAIADLSQAIDLNPRFRHTYEVRAELRKLLGDDFGCRSDLEKAAQL